MTSSSKEDKLILKSQQRFRSKKHNLITEEANKIALSANNDKKITFNRFNRIICIWRSNVLVCKEEEIKPNNTIKQ